MSKTLTVLPDKFERAGLNVKLVKGWKRRGSGMFEPKGVMFHHTASPISSGNKPSLGTVVNGRPGIPPPLCNILIGRNGVLHMVAAGRANHAGEGGPHRNIPKDSGNPYFVGFEVENNGIGEKWSADLLYVCVVSFAVTLRYLNSKPNMLIGHKEWAPTRKIDPANINMDHIRDDVHRIMRKLDRNKGRL